MSRPSKTDFLALYRKIDEDNLLEEPAIETRPQPAVSGQSTDKVPERSDLADTFNLFRTYLNSKPESFKEEISVSGKYIDNITKSIKREVSVAFKHEGNKIQYINFNSDLLSDLAKVQKQANQNSR